MELDTYHTISWLATPHGPLAHKPGATAVADPLYRLLARTIRVRGAVLDLNPGIGVASLAASSQGASVSAWEERRPMLRALQASAARHRGLRVAARLPWRVSEGTFDDVILVIGAERGNDWVRLQIASAAFALRPGGALWLAGSKKQGFERYFSWAQEALGGAEIVARDKGLRVARLRKNGDAAEPLVRLRSFEAAVRGRKYRFTALPGVFSAGELDPGSAALVEALPQKVSGLEVLDLGGGYGALSLPLAAAGARTTLLESSLAAVESSRLNFDRAGLAAEILHSDVDEALPAQRLYDIVVSNPPFHVGGRVVLDVAEAFVAAAHAHLRPGGRFYLVANQFLKYEVWMRKLFSDVRLRVVAGYKVIQASK